MIDESEDTEEGGCPAAGIKQTYITLPFNTVGDIKEHIFGEGDTPARHAFSDINLGAMQGLCEHFAITQAGAEEVYRIVGSAMLFAAWLGANYGVKKEELQ